MAPLRSLWRVLLLTVTWLTSGVTSDDLAMFQRAGTALTLPDGSAAPHSAVSAGSASVCAVSCVAHQQRLCRGVTFSSADSRCLMYVTCSDWPLTEEPAAGTGTVSYSRYRPNCTGEGQGL